MTKLINYDDPYLAFKAEGYEAGIYHPINQLRILCRKYNLHGPLPVIPVRGKKGYYELRIAAKYNPFVGENDPYNALSKVTHEVNRIDGIELAGVVAGKMPEWKIQFILLAFLEGPKSTEKPQITITPGIKPSPTMSFKNTAKPAKQAGASFIPSDVPDRVKALLEQKATATPDQARKIRQTLRKLGYYISKER